ncbi:P-loop containing nucleoside triphosphate hydrolase protein [Mycena filopes]|nr:P-loop containing nucleoside triphosphate hydrolase protein [Mycena filopes]KAJ7175663.1 P-loop containing nucleoside triphosphate hydrolase protein [Mycena filopes]
MEGIEDTNPRQSVSPVIFWKLLSRVFKLKDFRQNQLEAIIETTAGRDTFILMPTGAGKSLCFQLPAVFESQRNQALTVVVSPLRSLISDQVEALVAKGINAVGVTSDTEDSAVREYLSNHDSRPALLYCTPEKVQKNASLYDGLVLLHRQGLLGRFAIDEAHCITIWGEEFREAYRNLHTLRDNFPGVPIMALTSTAGPADVAQIGRSLKLENPALIRQSVNRPNLTYTVKPKPANGNVSEDIVRYIKEGHHGDSGIIYRTGRGECVRLARTLVNNGIKAAAYHAGMSGSDKRAVRLNWQRGMYQVIVATVAFGMGIDKADVRFVIHCDTPKSLENFHQETGRAGRDGESAECVLYYTRQDLKFILDLGSSDTVGNGRANPSLDFRKKAAAIGDFCEEKKVCRRVLLMRHFGEEFDAEECGNTCDNCANRDIFVSRDVSKEARSAVALVQTLETKHENITIRQCVEVFRGRKTANTRRNERHRNPHYGAGASLSYDLATLVFDELLKLDLLVERKVNRSPSGYHYYVKV